MVVTPSWQHLLATPIGGEEMSRTSTKPSLDSQYLQLPNALSLQTHYEFTRYDNEVKKSKLIFLGVP